MNTALAACNVIESQEELEVVTVSACQQHTASVIFIHGLGQSNLTWKMVINEALAPMLPNVKWILPQAPKRPVSLNQDALRPSWFDIAHLPPKPHEFDEVAISESISVVESLILEEVHAGMDPRRVVLVGFSQGAALSLMTALTTLHELGGVASLSGWIPVRVRDQVIHNSPALPILWCHGVMDDEVPMFYGHDAVSFLKHSVGIAEHRVCLKTYNTLKHSICDEELEDLATWVHDIISSPLRQRSYAE